MACGPFLSTLSLRRATNGFAGVLFLIDISIHALLAESDVGLIFFLRGVSLFLSTLSLRRATPIRDIIQWEGMNFYPRSPCGERQPMGRAPRQGIQISIHALLAESDYLATWKPDYICRISIHALLAESDNGHETSPYRAWEFLSTLSLRRATHAKKKSTRQATHFYPRSPCGERQFQSDRNGQNAIFLSTLSLRRATWIASNQMP